MKASQSQYVEIRGLQIHCRIWGREGAPKLFLTHGVHESSASYQFMVDCMKKDWHIIAPDWRGFGHSEHTCGDTYWTQDFLADLAFLLDHFQPDEPVRLVGHSLGGSYGASYAGTRPQRVAKFVDIEGLGPPSAADSDTPLRYGRWLDSLQAGERPPRWETPESFAERLRRANPRLTPERAAFLTGEWTKRNAEGLVTRREDSAHRHGRPTIWRYEDEAACWARITAPMLWVEGADSANIRELRGHPTGYEKRIASYPTLQRIVTIADCGHSVPIDQPEKLAQVVEEFMAG